MSIRVTNPGGSGAGSIWITDGAAGITNMRHESANGYVWDVFITDDGHFDRTLVFAPGSSLRITSTGDTRVTSTGDSRRVS